MSWVEPDERSKVHGMSEIQTRKISVFASSINPSVNKVDPSSNGPCTTPISGAKICSNPTEDGQDINVDRVYSVRHNTLALQQRQTDSTQLP